jgi:hypothetical protein
MPKRKRNLDLHPDGAWEVHIWSKTQKKIRTVLLDKRKINRINKINTYLGAKYVPRTKVVLRPYRRDAFWTNATTPLRNWNRMKAECVIDFNNEEFDDVDMAVAFNNGVVVGGFSFYLTETDFKITYLCSSKLVPNIGVVLVYAAEEFARILGKKRLSLFSLDNAKPFYFKVGLNYDTDTAGTSMYSYTNSNNSVTSRPYVRKKLHFPTREGHRMRKYLTPRRSNTNSNANSRARI